VATRLYFLETVRYFFFQFQEERKKETNKERNVQSKNYTFYAKGRVKIEILFNCLFLPSASVSVTFFYAKKEGQNKNFR
jgi:hypothetical protein